MELAEIIGSRVFVGTLVYLTVGHCLLVPLFKRRSSWGQSMEAARLALSTPIMIAVAGVGCNYWLLGLPPTKDTTLEFRVFNCDCTSSADWLALMTFSYHILDLLVLLCHIAAAAQGLWKPHAGLSTMAWHHLLLSVLAYHAMRCHFVQYYYFFYVGLAEFSSVPLTLMNLLRCLGQDPKAPAAPKLFAVMRCSFAVLFLHIRVVMWLLVNRQFYSDMFILLWPPMAAEDLLQRHPAVGKTAVWCWLLANVFLTMLQLIWAAKVIRLHFKAVSETRSKAHAQIQ
eukprot:TRINITY_DN58307_c0_g1_i1.p1 TRINITY_DN58307_c0_g1~~TRINITY_DN58307_c0_g1_i1.p1  ORF type:complete len:284 (+),score=36.67 TRINITY_DN58307_c0_g1_i1:32-883(+)